MKNSTKVLAVATVILVSALSIKKILTPRLLSCIPEITEITNQKHFSSTLLFAPDAILAELKPLILPKTVEVTNDDVIMAIGVESYEGNKSILYIKGLVPVETPKGQSALVDEIRSILHKQDARCEILDKEYEVFTGKSMDSL